MNLGNQPVEVLVEDVYLLVVPSPQSNSDPEEEERRAQAAKAERLENAELLHMRGDAEAASGMLVDRDCHPYSHFSVRFLSIPGLVGITDG